MPQLYNMDTGMDMDHRSTANRGRGGSNTAVCLSVVALLVALLAFLLAVILVADPSLVPSIRENYATGDAKPEEKTSESLAQESNWEPREEPERKKPEVYTYDVGNYNNPDDNTYVFAFYSNFRPNSFVTESGRPEGLFLDVVKEVCRVAGKTCRFIVFNSFTLVWDGELHASEGLNRRYFDGGFAFHTPPRAAAYAFSQPLIKLRNQAKLYRIPGENYGEDDAKRLKVGFQQGFFTSPECLRRELGGDFPEMNVVIFPTETDLIAAMQDGSIQLAFVLPSPGLEAALEGFKEYTSCSNGNVGVMMRKASPMRGWFDKALMELKKSGKFKSICEKGQDKYGVVSTGCAL